MTCSKDFPERLYGDQMRLKQVLISLVKLSLQELQCEGVIQIMASYDSALRQMLVQVHNSCSMEEMMTIREDLSERDRDNNLSIQMCESIIRQNGGKFLHAPLGDSQGNVFVFTMSMELERPIEQPMTFALSPFGRGSSTQTESESSHLETEELNLALDISLKHNSSLAAKKPQREVLQSEKFKTRDAIDKKAEI